MGRHVLRVAQAGSRDDERVIEIREGSSEQVIQTQLRALQTSTSQPSPTNLSLTPQSIIPGIVACNNCHARFAAGVKFCGKCGQGSFTILSESKINIAPETLGNSNHGNQSNQGQNSGNQTNNGQTNNGQNFVAPQTSHYGEPHKVHYPCPQCGNPLPDDAKFCGRCGFRVAVVPNYNSQYPVAQNQNAGFFNQAPRAVEIVCGKCRTSYSATAKFCGKCGIPLLP